MLLTPAEKQMAREVCIAFRQAVCCESNPLSLVMSCRVCLFLQHFSNFRSVGLIFYVLRDVHMFVM